jgi:hypothetical protein
VFGWLAKRTGTLRDYPRARPGQIPYRGPEPLCAGRARAQVSATVTNTGSRAGTDVAQLYLGDPAAAGLAMRPSSGRRGT